MKRVCIASLLMVGIAAASYADVTIKQTVEGKGMGMSGKTTGVTYIKGHKMRSDIVSGDKTMTTIYDVDAQKMYIFDSKKKEADVWDMAAFGQEMSKSVDVSSMKASVTPNGQTKPIAGKTAAGYDMEISMAAGMAGSKDAKDLNMTVTIAGPMWIVKDAPGAKDFAGFYKAAVEKGFIFGDPKAAKAQPGPAKAMAEMYNKMSDIGGIAYESDMQIKMSGSGPMAGLLARMGNVSTHTIVDSVETGAIADTQFAPPADYKVTPKK